jgi:hypothetical protein
VFEIRKRIPKGRFRTAGCNIENQGVSLGKLPAEGVSSVSGHRSRDGRPRLEEGGRERGVGRRRGGGRRRRSHCCRAELTGEGRSGAMVRGFQIREHRKRDKEMASPSLTLAWPGASPRGSRHGRRPWTSAVRVARALGSPKMLGNWTGRERKGRGAHQREELGQRRLGLARWRSVNRGGAPATALGACARKLRWRGAE